MDSSQYGDPKLTGGLKSRDIKCFVFPEACMLCSRDDCRIGGMGISTAHVLLTACAALPFLSLCLVPSSSMMPVVVRGQVGGSGTCVLVNCSIPALECMLDSQCRKASFCNAECTGKKNVEACNLLCELTYGYNSTKYRALLQCMSDHGCLPVNPPDGVCLANDSDTIKNLTDMAQVKDKAICFQAPNPGVGRELLPNISSILGLSNWYSCFWSGVFPGNGAGVQGLSNLETKYFEIKHYSSLTPYTTPSEILQKDTKRMNNTYK